MLQSFAFAQCSKLKSTPNGWCQPVPLAPVDELFPSCRPDFINVTVRTPKMLVDLVQFRMLACDGRHVAIPGRAILDEWDLAPAMNLSLLYVNGRIMGTIRGYVSCGAAKERSTPLGHFFKELKTMCPGESVLDAGRLLTLRDGAVDPTLRLFALLQNITALADEHACRYIVAPARLDHKRFYLEMGFEELLPDRRLPEWPEPIALLRLNWLKERESLRDHKLYRLLFSDRNPLRLGVPADASGSYSGPECESPV